MTEAPAEVCIGNTHGSRVFGDAYVDTLKYERAWNTIIFFDVSQLKLSG